jgi:acylphosphatase
MPGQYCARNMARQYATRVPGGMWSAGSVTMAADYIGNVPEAPEPSRTGVDDRTAEHPVRLTAFVHGQVQGVGFRWWTRARALELGLTGSATNLADGRVQVVAEGTKSACERLLVLLRGGGTPGSVAVVVGEYGAARGERGFAER